MSRSEIVPGRTYAGRSGRPRTVVALRLVDWAGIRADQGRYAVHYRHPGDGPHDMRRGCVIEVFARWALREEPAA